MPTPAYMTVKGISQGLISAGALGEDSVGASSQPAHKDKILVQAMSHSIMVPGGVGSGHRMHKPLVITKTLDKSSPLLNNALSNGEPLTCRLEWYRTSGNGEQEHFYTIELSEAIIIAIDLVMPHCQDSDSDRYTQLEKVHFAYQNITWKHEIGRTHGIDTWQGEGRT